jgi:hypothetical protein
MTNDEGEALILGCSDLYEIEDKLKLEMSKRTEFSTTLWIWWAWELYAMEAEIGVDIKHHDMPSISAAQVCMSIAEGDTTKSDESFFGALSSLNLRNHVKRYLEFFDHEENSPREMAREFAEIQRIEYLLMIAIEYQRNAQKEYEAACLTH